MTLSEKQNDYKSELPVVPAIHVITTHLSYAQKLLRLDLNLQNISEHIDFAKFVLLKTEDNLKQNINPDILWEEYKNNQIKK